MSSLLLSVLVVGLVLMPCRARLSVARNSNHRRRYGGQLSWKVARKFGATHTVKANDYGRSSEDKPNYDGGADYVLVTVGSTSAIQQGFLMSRPHGMIVMVGRIPTSESVTLPTTRSWLRKNCYCKYHGFGKSEVGHTQAGSSVQNGRLKLG